MKGGTRAQAIWIRLGFGLWQTVEVVDDPLEGFLAEVGIIGGAGTHER